MMAWIVRYASDDTATPLFSSAWCASVRTACSTASRACSVLGLNSFFSRADRLSASSVSVVRASARLATAVIAFSVYRLLLGRIGFGRIRLGRGGIRIGCGGQRVHQRRVLQHFADQLFRAGLAVHVGQQVGELGAGV